LHFDDASTGPLGISDIPIVAFGSRAHLEEKALATVLFFNMTLLVLQCKELMLTNPILHPWFRENGTVTS